MAGVNVHHYHYSPELAFTTMITFGVTATLRTALMYCANHCFKWEQVGTMAFAGKLGAQITVWVMLVIFLFVGYSTSIVNILIHRDHFL